MQTFEQRAADLDAADSLAVFRDRFAVDPAVTYLDGNSLGRLPLATIDRVAGAVSEEWGEGLVRSWSHWFDLPARLGAKVGQIIGASGDEVRVCDSTSVNFYKLARAILAAAGDRRRVVTNAQNFPSDLYVLGGLGAEVTTLATEDDAEIEAALGPDVALLTLSHVAFKSGRRHDLARLTAAAHRHGARVLFDLSHSAGAVEIDLAAIGADAAVGCTYKYLNGGPGAPAYLFVRRDLQETLANPIRGWFGQRDAFEFGIDYQQAAGIDRFLVGTPPVLSMIAVEPGLDLLIEAGMARLESKSAKQGDFLIEMYDASLANLGFGLETPRLSNERGSHVSFSHAEAWRINQALIADHGIIPDFRAPHTLRIGITPLTTRFEELVRLVRAIEAIGVGRTYERFPLTRSGVT